MKLHAVVVAAALTISGVAHAGSRADDLVAEGKRLYADGDMAGAYERFRAAADLDDKHPTALYNAGLAARKAGLLEQAAVAYRGVLARDDNDLDVVFGLAEVERALGNVEAARALYTRWLRDEQRDDREALRLRAQAGLDALPIVAAPMTPPSLDRPAALTTAPPVVVPPVAETPIVPTPVPVLSKAVPLGFYGDALQVDALLAVAEARRGTGDVVGARQAQARAAAVDPDDVVVTSPRAEACDAARAMAIGENALLKGEGRTATVAFQRALACDPTRAAPVWGLSRAADLEGDRAAGKQHAQRYARSRAPDVEPATTRAAWWRSEQP